MQANWYSYIDLSFDSVTETFSFLMKAEENVKFSWTGGDLTTRPSQCILD